MHGDLTVKKRRRPIQAIHRLQATATPTSGILAASNCNDSNASSLVVTKRTMATKSPYDLPKCATTKAVARNSPFDLFKCARPNILALEPYRCARDDYKDDGTNTLLDANENAYGPGLDLEGDVNLANGALNGDVGIKATDVDLLGLNRYPDP